MTDDAPRRHLLSDPRFPKVFTKAMRRAGLYPYHADRLKRLAIGELDPRHFPCCHSGCRPCNQQFVEAAESIVAKLERPRRWWRFW